MGFRTRRPVSTNPAENDFVSGGPMLTPPGSAPDAPQQLLGNQEILERIAQRGVPGSPVTRQQGGPAYDSPNPQADLTLRMPFLDGVPGGSGARDAINDWYKDPASGTKPSLSGSDVRSNSCGSGPDCPDTSDPHVIGPPAKSF